MTIQPSGTKRTGLCDLPAEVSRFLRPTWTLLTDVQIVQYIHILSLSPYFPQTSRYINSVLSTASSAFVAKYLLDLYSVYGPSDILVRALRHPICDIYVTKDIRRIWDRRRGFIEVQLRAISDKSGEEDGDDPAPPEVTAPPLTCSELPRRLFRQNVPPSASEDIIPLLTYLFETYKPSPNSHKGYPLCRAILTSNKPLVQFLLSKGADPSIKDNLAVQIAISKRDLDLVKMLVERPRVDPTAQDDGSNDTEFVREHDQRSPLKRSPLKKIEASNKRARLSDRINIDQKLVQLAMESGTKEIVQYFVHEKGESVRMRGEFSLTNISIRSLGCMPPLRSIMNLNQSGKSRKRR